MASSRLYKVGTIFSRISGLLKSGGMKEEDKPIWYEIYKAFPPKYEPKFSRPAPDIPIQNIFYPEDAIRAKFHKECSDLIKTVNLNDSKQTSTQQFISIYNKLKEDVKVSEEDLFTTAVKEFKLERSSSRPQEKLVRVSDTVSHKKEKINVATAFKEAMKEIEDSKK